MIVHWGIEKADHVVVIGGAAAALRYVTQTSVAEGEQLFALGGVNIAAGITESRRPGGPSAS